MTAQPELLRLVPGAPEALRDILDGARGVVEPPVRSEIFGVQRFAQHGRSLGETHRAARPTSGANTFSPRLRSNIQVLREAHRYIGLQATTGYDISPAAEWLLENFHLIESQLKEIHEGLPSSYFRQLPVLVDEPLSGLPRVYGIAWAFVAHTDGAFNEELLVQFLGAYQEVRELNLSELWALPTTLRVVLVENLRRLAERVATNKAARELANLVCDKLETYTEQALDELLALLAQRGVARMFLGQIAQRLQDLRNAEHARYHEWLHGVLPDWAALQTQQSADQAADNLSVSNAVTSLRAIGDADWPDIVALTNGLMRAMLTSPVFAAEHPATRDLTLHDIEQLAKRSGKGEVAVANTLLELMRKSEARSAGGDAQDGTPAVAAYWLRGAGRPALIRALGLHESLARGWNTVTQRFALPAYLGTLGVVTACMVAWLLQHHGGGLTGDHVPLWLTLLGGALMMIPVSEAVVAVINRLISESVRPTHLPRLLLAGGIPAEHRVMVVIPCMLSDPAAARELAHRLQLHYLANPEPHAQFALLSDWPDALQRRTPADDALLDAAVQHIRELNTRYPRPEGDSPRFLLLHRERKFSLTEQRWIGWERKRGKLELLIAALATGDRTAFIDSGSESSIAPDTKYIVTLDSDTGLPPGRLRELVGVAAHPQNQPRVDAARRMVESGYGILQPRVVTPLPAPRDFTLYHWLFAGQSGIDPYSVASSEVYQDVFGEGTFTGKGLLNVAAMHAVLDQRLPDGQVLSHDLLEGSIARCGAVTDIAVMEEAPFHSDVAMSRVHRWTRGDWQLLPLLLRPARYAFRGVNRWKMFDNLRRSLVAPASLGLLLLALADGVVSPWVALFVVFAAYTAGPLMGAVAGFAPSRDDLAFTHFYRLAALDLARAFCGGVWHLAQLPQQALMAADAVLRALWRTALSRRLLLQWTTAAAAQASAKTAWADIVRRHWRLSLVALALLGVLFGIHTPHPVFCVVLCTLWAATPLSIWYVSRPRPPRANTMPAQDMEYLEGIARDTWRLFERCVGPQDNHLPPDNLQTTPHDIVAHRTSPTNIGLYLLSVACARRFGWIGTQEMLARLQATYSTLVTMQRHRGHFFNWYDTQTCAPLLPMYVSTVDSGNLSGMLLAVAQACRELTRAPYDRAAARRAVEHSRRRLVPMLALLPDVIPGLPADAGLMRLLAMPDPLAEGVADPSALHALLQQASAQVAEVLPETHVPIAPSRPLPRDELAWALADHITTLRSALQDITAAGKGDTSQRLLVLAREFEQMAWEADFRFLYHAKRRLFHIGYRVAEQQLDAAFYDLLASESRLTSVLAIAKGDVPVSHWATLGRPFYAVGAEAGLRSWSGSMFEYMMPGLILHEPHGSVLREACHAALKEQIAFGASQGVPWGISESAYAGSDNTLAYQYAPQGVPRLALRRTPPDELVVAPYATGLAAQTGPRRAAANFRKLQEMAARGRYGFIEALDFTPARQATNEKFTRVSTFMAHHQGMTIVSLANVLLGGPAQRWGMANPSIEAVASLLHEHAPREVSTLHAPPSGPPPQALQKRAPGLLRRVMPGVAALEPTHLLSNGRYSVVLRANGAGCSRWGQTAITRSRDDALRDVHGSFFYVRWRDAQGALTAPASITQHPAPAADAHYDSTYHADRMCFDAEWTQFAAHTTVWVSPEDDIEFRQVDLRNLGDKVMEVELMSVFDITLSDPRADEAHPAFTNMFIRTEWQPAHQALVFQRKPRLPTETGLHAAHFLTETSPQVTEIRVQADRARWLGRNRAAHQPLAQFDPAPELPADAADAAAGVALDTGLDPVCAMSVRLRIAPGAKATLTFATAASNSAGVLRAVIDKYRQPSHVQRSSLMSTTLTGIRLRDMRLNSETFAAIQMLSTALVMSVARPRGRPQRADETPAACDRRLLWRFGLSGERPLVLVFAGVTQGLGLLRSLAQALRIWSWGGIGCDLVVVNAEPNSYLMTLQREIAALRERYLADNGGLAHAENPAGNANAGFHLLRAEELSAEELITLKALARVRFNADGRPLHHHVQEWIELHEHALQERNEVSVTAVATTVPLGAVKAAQGEFAAQSQGEFRFDVSPQLRPQRPWINVLSNPGFGAQISEAGGGYTWAVNSRMNQVTAWSNDPVADPPSEWFLLHDRRTRQTWSVSPNAWGREDAAYRVSHGQGYTVVTHRHGDVEVTATWCVDPESSLKQVRIRLVNRGHRAAQLRVAGIAEWMMGANRSDRSTTHSAVHRADFGAARKLTALTCTQKERAGGFGDGTAFLALAGPAGEAEDWTCDRRECFDARGRIALPDFFGQRAGGGLDPCAAISSSVTLQAGDTAERVFLLGYAGSPQAARELAQQAASADPVTRLEQVRAHWDTLLGAASIKTPDPLMDVMVNRWLLYQSVSCRLWAKAGFYQAGGATGFRDQLQDSLALAWAAPHMLREQIVIAASRQFTEGDVQHWWHAPSGAGVRTHFSDDLLWLPYACTHYVQTTGDDTLLDESVNFIEGPRIPEGAEDAYYAPDVSTEKASVYEHAARAIDRSLRVGVHGLPLMGSGDWNDGMNRVGIEGKGESVWLGWFLCKIVHDFAPVARARNDEARARRWETAAQKWKTALLGEAWDGQWFKRAYFDDGTPLGSHANKEARIDLIAQAWAVLSHVAPNAQQRMALDAVEAHLVDHEAGLLHLLHPPLANAIPSAGYIQAYPAGVRENGGQYSHGGVWALMAQARWARNQARASGTEPDGDTAYRYFTYLNPAHRSRHPTHGAVYGIEPYVIAGDVYTQPPYVGRGGWSWYTGAAAWLHRAAIESIFGLRQCAHELSFKPCLPSQWPQAELTLTRDARSMRFILVRGDEAAAAPMLAATPGAQVLRPGQALQWRDLPAQSTFIVPCGAVLQTQGPGADGLLEHTFLK